MKKLEVVGRGASGTPEFDVFVTASPRAKLHDFSADLSKDPELTGADHSQAGQPFRVDEDIKLDKNESTKGQATLSWPQEIDKVRVAVGPNFRSGDRFWHINDDGSRELLPRRSLDRLLKKLGKKRDKDEKGVHAEVAALEAIKGQWSTWLPDVQDFKEKFNYDPICWLQIHVTRSPCVSCAGAILDMKQFAATKGWRMKIKVSAMSLYHVDGRDSSEGIAGIAKLQGGGVTVSVLRLPKAQAEKLVAKNPKLSQLVADKAAKLASVILGQG